MMHSQMKTTREWLMTVHFVGIGTLGIFMNVCECKRKAPAKTTQNVASCVNNRSIYISRPVALMLHCCVPLQSSVVYDVMYSG